MNDQPREEKAPQGADQPTVEQPTTPAETPAAPAQQPPAQPATPAADGGTAESPATPGQPTAPADQTAVLGQQPPAQPATPAAGAASSQQAPPTPQLSQPGPGQSYGAWGPPAAAPRQSGGFRRFVGHRATQLVAVGILGLLIGGGIVGGIAAASHHGPRDGRPGIHRQHNGPQGFDGHGPGFRGGQGNNQGQGNSEGS